MALRGVRGATTIAMDNQENVLAATRELLQTIQCANPDLKTLDIGSAFFTTTADITSAFPAAAAREIGWDHVPMICTNEIPVSDSLPMCIRVLILWNTDQAQDNIQHIYLREAKKLRPDLINN